MSLRVGTPLPDLSDATIWLNTNEPNATVVVPCGVPILVHFWAVSCSVCHMNMPSLRSLLADNVELNLMPIAIHMPRSSNDLDIIKVHDTCLKLGIDEPCAIDNDHILGNRFESGGIWPIYYLFGTDGRLKRRAIGDFGISVMKAALESMRRDSLSN